MRWLKEQSHKATAGEDVTKPRWLDAHLGGKPLATINRSLIDTIAEAKLAQGVSCATVNRTPEVLRAILRKCVEDWEWLDRVPKIRMLKEPVRRIWFLRQAEARRLIAALPEHLAAMASFSLATGLRAANVTGLQWFAVDLVRRVAGIHPDQAKGRRAIPVHLNTEAVLLVRQQVGTHPTHVFSMICGIRGRVGTCRRLRRWLHYRRWAAGRVRTWCGVARILPPITWRLSPRRYASR